MFTAHKIAGMDHRRHPEDCRNGPERGKPHPAVAEFQSLRRSFNHKFTAQLLNSTQLNFDRWSPAGPTFADHHAERLTTVSVAGDQRCANVASTVLHYCSVVTPGVPARLAVAAVSYGIAISISSGKHHGHGHRHRQAQVL